MKQLLIVGMVAATAVAVAETVTLAPAEGVTTNVLQVYSGDTALEFAGPGTVKLNPANAHTGGTTLSGGTLELSGNISGGGHSPVGAGTFTVAGGTLRGSGTFGGNIIEDPTPRRRESPYRSQFFLTNARDITITDNLYRPSPNVQAPGVSYDPENCSGIVTDGNRIAP